MSFSELVTVLLFAFTPLVIISTLQMIIDQKSHCVNILCTTLQYRCVIDIEVFGQKYRDN